MAFSTPCFTVFMHGIKRIPCIPCIDSTHLDDGRFAQAAVMRMAQKAVIAVVAGADAGAGRVVATSFAAVADDHRLLR